MRRPIQAVIVKEVEQCSTILLHQQKWSFSTYMRPSVSDSSDTYTIASGEGSHAGNAKKFAVEGPLWAAMSATTYNLAVGGTGAPTLASLNRMYLTFRIQTK